MANQLGYFVLLVLSWITFCCYGQTLSKNDTKITAITVDASVFEEMLGRESALVLTPEVDPQPGDIRFLNTFTRYILTVDFRLETDESYVQLKRISKQTAEYNRKLSHNFPFAHPLDFFVSITPHGTITEQAKLVASMVEETNLIFRGTVSAFVSNYHFQLLGIQTVPLMRQDILLSTQVLRNQSDLLFGLVLDSRNCQRSSSYWAALPTEYVDIVMYMTDYKIMQNHPKAHLFSIVPCIVQFVKNLFIFRRPTFVFKMPIDFNINPRNGSISLRSTSFSRLENLTKKLSSPYIQTIYALGALSLTKKPNNASDPVMRTLQTHENWLRQESLFNKRYTGISVFTKHEGLNAVELLPSVLNNFCSVNFQQRVVDTLDPRGIDRHYQTLQRMLKYIEDPVNFRGWAQPCERAGNELSFKVDFYGNKSHPYFHDINNAIILNITAIALEVDRKLPSVSTSLNFYFNPCYGTVNCNDSLGSTKGERFNASFDLFSRNFVNAKEHVMATHLGRRPQVNILLNLMFCGAITSHNLLYLKPDGVTFQVPINHVELVKRGAFNVSKSILTFVEYCNLAIAGSLNDHISDKFNYTPSARLTFQVEVFGCDPRSTDLKGLTEITRFTELLSYFAASVDYKVFVGSALENQKARSANEKYSCIGNDHYLSREECDCGYWRASDVDLMGYGKDFGLELKKSLALSLFEETHLKKSINGSDDPAADSYLLLKILIPTIAFAILKTVAAAGMIVRYRKKITLSRREMYDFYQGQQTKTEAGSNDTDVCSTIQKEPFDKKRYEVSIKNFKIDNTKTLGSGAFGAVVRGILTSESSESDVAVKMVKKQDADRSHGHLLALKGLISEIKILTYIGDHKHIVRIIGAYTAKLSRGKLYVFLELCELGSLFSFLRNIHMTSPKTTDKVEETEYTDMLRESSKIDDDHKLPKDLCNDLFRISREIASGMEFLASKNMVHADLATRNVLLDSAKSAKISDFGLSRRLYDYTEYVKREQAPLPWRWMPPESLKRLIMFKTDVWAFGVTLWEIFTLGDEPYPGLSWDINFPLMLERGIRLEKPRYNEKDVYTVMRQCWSTEPANRPTFADLTQILGNKTGQFSECVIGF